jgi:hypothetical protein
VRINPSSSVHLGCLLGHAYVRMNAFRCALFFRVNLQQLVHVVDIAISAAIAGVIRLRSPASHCVFLFAFGQALFVWVDPMKWWILQFPLVLCQHGSSSGSVLARPGYL